MSKYTYSIDKNEGEGLEGYGYTLTLYRGTTRLVRTGAFATKQMALEGLANALRWEMEQHGILQVADITEGK